MPDLHELPTRVWLLLAAGPVCFLLAFVLQSVVLTTTAALAVALQKLMSPLSRRQASAGVGAGTRPRSTKDWRSAATMGVAGNSPTAAASALPSSACGTCHR